MTRVRVRGEQIRSFILDNVKNHPDVSKVTSDHFGITRQAVNKHLHRLVDAGCLTEQGTKRSRTYKLASLVEWQQSYTVKQNSH